MTWWVSGASRRSSRWSKSPSVRSVSNNLLENILSFNSASFPIRGVQKSFSKIFPHTSAPNYGNAWKITIKFSTVTSHISLVILFIEKKRFQFQGDYSAMLDHYRRLLKYIKSAVTKNYSEKSINSILGILSLFFFSEISNYHFQITFPLPSRWICCSSFMKSLWMRSGWANIENSSSNRFFQDARNDRLWFKTNTKLGKLYFDMREFGKMEKIINQLKESCTVHLLFGVTIIQIDKKDDLFPLIFHNFQTLFLSRPRQGLSQIFP